MRKNSFYVAAVLSLLLIIGCSSDAEVVNSNEDKASVTVRVSDFSMSMDEFVDAPAERRATETALNYAGVKAITLAFYDGNTEVYKTTQYRADASTYTTFGEFSCLLPVGSYSMVVVGRGSGDGDVFTLTSPTQAAYTSERARETFSKTQSVTVNNSTSLDIQVTPQRVVSMLTIFSTDQLPADVAKIRTIFAAGSKSFNPTSGLATDNNGFSVDISSQLLTVGSTITIGSYVFLNTDEQTMNITIQTLDANDQVIVTKEVQNVPMKRNRKTKLTGAVFSPYTSSAQILFETSWLDDAVVDF